MNDNRLLRAYFDHDGVWPRELTSGIMFYEGLRITIEEFASCRTLCGEPINGNF